jgi:hypothetical protein
MSEQQEGAQKKQKNKDEVVEKSEFYKFAQYIAPIVVDDCGCAICSKKK